MATVPRSIQNTWPLGSISNEPEISSRENLLFVLGLFEQISNAYCCACSGNIKKTMQR